MDNKIQRGLFERTVVFSGRHAQTIEDLVMVGIFSNNHEVAEFALMVGLLFNKTSKIDKETEKEIKIGKETMRDSGGQVIMLHRFCMLLHDGYIEFSERLNRAFAFDDKGDDAKGYEEITESYIRGGLDLLEEKIFRTGPRPKGAMKEIDFIRNEVALLEEINQMMEEVIATKKGEKALTTEEILNEA